MHKIASLAVPLHSARHRRYVQYDDFLVCDMVHSIAVEKYC